MVKQIKDITGIVDEIDTKGESDPIKASAFMTLGDGVIPQEILNSGTGKFEVASFNFEIKPTSPISLNVTVNDGTALIKGQVIGSSKIKDVQIVGTVTLTAGDGSNPRKDLIVVKTDTNVFGEVRHRGNAKQTDFEVIPGTPAASPVVAKTDAQLNEEGKVRLATVTVPTGATSIAVADIDNGKDFLKSAEPTTFLDLSDTPSLFSGSGGDFVKVNAGGTAIEFVTIGAGVTDFISLTDTPASFAGAGGQSVRVNAGATALEFFTPTGGVTTFTGLTDTPANFTGSANKLVRVNAGATALEFVASSGGIDNTAFHDGGDSFGALATLGTNDNFDLAFETFGGERVRITTAGTLQVGPATNSSGLLTVRKDANSLTVVRVENATDNTAACAGIGVVAGSGGTAVAGSFEAFPANFTPIVGIEASSVEIASNTATAGIFLTTRDNAPVSIKTQQILRFKVDTNTTGSETALLLSVAGAAVTRVSVGAVDSGGSGFKLLRVPN